MDKVINFLNLGVWSYLIIKIGLSIFIDPLQYLNSDITLDLYILRGIQLFQIIDILLILIGKSKGSILGSFFQILGRNIVTLIFMQPQSHKLKFAAVVIIWAIADANRYLYYLFKTNLITGLLRYNSFIVLYPVGVFCQMIVINDFIARHEQHITNLYFYMIRFVQVCIVLGMIAIYNYMLKSRKKFMKSLKGQLNQNKRQNQRADSQQKQKDPKQQLKKE